MDSVNAQAELGKHFLKFAGKGLSSFKSTSLGKKLLGYSAYPLFAQKLSEKQIQVLDEYAEIAKTAEEPKVELTNLEKIRKSILDKFAIGDLLSFVGLSMYFIQSKVGPEKPGLIGSLFRNASLLMTFLGSTTAGVGRALGFDKEVLYGEEYAEKMLNDAETKNKRIFSIYDEKRILELIAEAKRLDKTLIYKDGLRESILERHEQKQIGGIFDGPAGTGKTDGVNCILGKWAAKVQREGNIPVIAELNLSNFDDYITSQKQKQREALEFIEHFIDADGNTKGTFATNQGLMVLEALIRKIQGIKNNVDEYNKNSTGPKKQLAVFVDEFDKALQTRSLKGCDKTRLRNLLIQFNELFVKSDLLLTSNTKLEDMMKEIAEHVKIDDQNTGQAEVIDPMRDRLSAKNRALVESPAAKEQALILAGRLLVDYPRFIDWNDFGTSVRGVDNFEYDREQFAQIIENEITSTLNTKINGRQLANACEQLKSMLLGKARQLNSQKKLFNDKTWEQMPAEVKIEKTGALIDRDMLKQVVASKVQNMNLGQSQKDFDQGFRLIDTYLKSPETSKVLKNKHLKLTREPGKALEDALASAYKKTTHGNNTVYVAKTPIDFNGNSFQHLIIQYPSVNSEGATYCIAFADLANKTLDDLTMYDFVISKRVSAARFADEIVPKINKAAEDPLHKVIDSVLGAISSGGNLKLNEADVKTIADAAVNNFVASTAA